MLAGGAGGGEPKTSSSSSTPSAARLPVEEAFLRPSAREPRERAPRNALLMLEGAGVRSEHCFADLENRYAEYVYTAQPTRNFCSTLFVSLSPFSISFFSFLL